MKFRPLHDWALIRPGKEREKTSGGIIVPDAAREKPERGEVLAVGEGAFKEERDNQGEVINRKFVKTEVKPGDQVLFEKYGVTEVEVEDEELILVRENNILGTLSPS